MPKVFMVMGPGVAIAGLESVDAEYSITTVHMESHLAVVFDVGLNLL